MKPIFNLLLFCFSVTLFTQNISGKVTYEVRLNFTKENLKEMEINKDKATNTMRKVLQNSTNTNVLLRFNGNQSHYKVIKKLEINDRKPLNMSYAIAGGEKQFFTELLTNKNTIIECELLEECFLVEQPKIVWKLTQTTKIIGGYLCYKAINTTSTNKKKKPIAWYTPKIPASFGPKQYFGLPGLILEVEESAVTFTATKIILNPNEKVIIEAMNGTKITKKEYNIKLKKSYSDIYTNK